MIPLSVPNLKGNERKYVDDALSKEWVSTGGNYINIFENNIANYLGVESAVACQSGTAGLHLALRVCDVDINDEVIVPTLTFIAAVNPIKYIGASPIFIDCDDSLTIDVIKIEKFIEMQCEFKDNKLFNKHTNKIISAIIIVHVFGNNVNMEKIIDIATKYNLKVIEDATEALGSKYIRGKYKDKYLGTIGDCGVFSFNGNKIITTGGGGMVVAREHNILQKVKYLSTQAKDNAELYIHNNIGYNYRMTNLQAALGVAQLEKIEEFIETKKNNYNLYKELLKNEEDIKLMPFNSDIRPNYWFYSLYIKNINVLDMMNYLKECGIQTRMIWKLINEQLPYVEHEAYKIEKAKDYQEHILNIPCSSNLTAKEVEYVVEKIKEYMQISR